MNNFYEWSFKCFEHAKKRFWWIFPYSKYPVLGELPTYVSMTCFYHLTVLDISRYRPWYASYPESSWSSPSDFFYFNFEQNAPFSSLNLFPQHSESWLTRTACCSVSELGLRHLWEPAAGGRGADTRVHLCGPDWRGEVVPLLPHRDLYGHAGCLHWRVHSLPRRPQVLPPQILYPYQSW